MAERINSGQIQLRGAGNVPMVQVQGQPVDFVAPRVQAQADSVLAQTLDRITSVLFDKAAQQSQLEGQQYVADNPPTPKQLLDAMGGNTSELGRTGENLSGNSFRIYDRAVAKARSIQLSSAFESEGINELLKVHKQVQLSTMTAEKAREKIKAVTDGLMPKNFAEIDAEAAVKFRATMAMHGNSVLKDAYRIEAERTLEQRQIKANFDFQNKLDLIPIMVASGGFSSYGKELPISELTNVMQKQIFDEAILNGLSVEKTQAQLDKFTSVFKEAKIDAITKEISKPEYINDPIGTLSKIRQGNLGDRNGSINGLFKDMTSTDIAKINLSFWTIAGYQKTLNDNQREEGVRTGVAQFVPLYTQAISMKNRNSEAYKKLTQQISGLAQTYPGSVPNSILQNLLEPQAPVEEKSNPRLLVNIFDQIEANKITSSDQIMRFYTKGINGPDAVSLVKHLHAADRRDDSAKMRVFKDLAGIPTVVGVNVSLQPNAVEFTRLLDIKAKAAQFEADAFRDGKVLSLTELTQKLEADILVTRNSSEIQQAKDLLKRIEASLGDGQITLDNLPTLRRKYEGNRSKTNELDAAEVNLKKINRVR